jgi:hypothetical protein
MMRGLIAGGICGIVFALGPAGPAEAKTIGKGKMTLTVSTEINGQIVTFVTQGAIKIKSKKEANCRKSRSISYRATDPSGQPITMIAQLSKGNGTYVDRNDFPYNVGDPPEPGQVPTAGGTYTFRAQVPKQKDLKSKDKCTALASPTVTTTVPPFQPIL